MQFLLVCFLSLFSQHVGTDIYGNRYYETIFKNYWGNNKRYCIYNGTIEPSKIPPEWYGWMHYQATLSKTTEVAKLSNRYFWQKLHMPTLTGTMYRFLPIRHNLHNNTHSIFDDKQKMYNTADSGKIWRP